MTALDCLFGDQPFFAGEVISFQGDPLRHLALVALINKLSKARPASHKGPLRILEIGSWVGVSLFTLAQAAKDYTGMQAEITCVDRWAPYFTDKDKATEKGAATMEKLLETGMAYSLFCHNAACADAKVSPFRGTINDYAQRWDGAKFDMIFIDGSHYYADVLNDLTEANAMLNEGGIICGDDLEHQAEELEGIDLDLLLDQDYVRLERDGKILAFHPGVLKAIFEFFGKTVSCYSGLWSQEKTATGFTHASLKDTQSFVPDHFPPEWVQNIQLRAGQNVT